MLVECELDLCLKMVLWKLMLVECELDFSRYSTLFLLKTDTLEGTLFWEGWFDQDDATELK